MNFFYLVGCHNMTHLVGYADFTRWVKIWSWFHRRWVGGGGGWDWMTGSHSERWGPHVAHRNPSVPLLRVQVAPKNISPSELVGV